MKSVHMWMRIWPFTSPCIVCRKDSSKLLQHYNAWTPCCSLPACMPGSCSRLLQVRRQSGCNRHQPLPVSEVLTFGDGGGVCAEELPWVGRLYLKVKLWGEKATVVMFALGRQQKDKSGHNGGAKWVGGWGTVSTKTRGCMHGTDPSQKQCKNMISPIDWGYDRSVWS